MAVGSSIMRAKKDPLFTSCFHSYNGRQLECWCTHADGKYTLSERDQQLKLKGKLYIDNWWFKKQQEALSEVKAMQVTANIPELTDPKCKSARFIDPRAKQLTWMDEQNVKFKF